RVPAILSAACAPRGERPRRSPRQPGSRCQRRLERPVMVSRDEIAARRAEIQERIGRACARRGRDPSVVTLLAVTKTHPPETVRLAASAGLTHFGENRVAEGASKIEALRNDLPDLVWKLIGPLQTNKARPALQYFSAVESLDRERLAVRLEGLLALEGRT